VVPALVVVVVLTAIGKEAKGIRFGESAVVTAPAGAGG
jgi:SHS family lactate transporter-like MFS transporter